MKAVIYTHYGPPDVLRLVELEKPVPKDDEILVRVVATTVTHGDTRMRAFRVPRWQWLPARLYLGIRQPRRPVLGMELAGQVEAVGAAVTRFKPGDAVYGSTFAAGFGGHAEYKCLPAGGIIALKPANVPFEEAAAVPVGGMTALRMLRKANVQRGQQVLIYGASGSVGTFAVQLARHLGAEVTGVCSTPNLDLVRELGAAQVVDYTREDFTRRGAAYDVVFDAVGLLAPARGRQALKPGGAYLSVTTTSAGGEKLDDLNLLNELLEAGTLHPVIDRIYPLEQIVEAHRYVDGGHKKGNVVVTVGSPHGLHQEE